MSNKPIFVATHPRACSTAFERVFMTRRDTLNCVHEPFGDAFYFGPERLSERFENNEKERLDSGFAESTYKTVMDRLDRDAAEGKRLFIKDIAHYLIPPNDAPASIAPSLDSTKKGVGTEAFPALAASHAPNGTSTSTPSTNGTTNGVTNGTTNGTINGTTNGATKNPTVIPSSLLSTFHFTFLIRHPRSSIPSYYRCCLPPLSSLTGFSTFLPAEAGYVELRQLFDFLRSDSQIVSPGTGHPGVPQICVVDADDLLDNPEGIIRAYCEKVGLDYDPQMLVWDSKEDAEYAKAQFEKWRGFHEDAIDSTGLKKREHKKKTKSVDEEDQEWEKKFGKKGGELIRKTVDECTEDYEYLRQFRLKPLNA